MDGDGTGGTRFRAGVRDEVTGGHRGRAAEKAAAAMVTELYPQAPRLVAAAQDFHARAAAGAVTAGARAVIFTCAGLPRRGEPLHYLADAAAPGAWYCYAGADPEVTWMRRVVMPACRRVTAVTAAEDDPAAVIAAAARSGVPVDGPVAVHVILAAQYWDDATAREVLAGYGPRAPRRLLAPGSSVCLSAGWTAPTPEGDARAEALGGLLGVPFRRHSREAVASWMAAAGLALADPPGVADVRAYHNPGLRGQVERSRPVSRVLGAVGLLPG